MKRVDVKRTNAEATQKAIQQARNGLTNAMAGSLDGEWHLTIRWTSPAPNAKIGIVDHLEPQQFGSDRPAENTGVAGPCQEDMRRIERAITNLICGAVERHPYGRATLKVTWQASRVATIEHVICPSHKVDPVESHLS